MMTEEQMTAAFAASHRAMQAALKAHAAPYSVDHENLMRVARNEIMLAAGSLGVVTVDVSDPVALKDFMLRHASAADLAVYERDTLGAAVMA